ncbi:protein P21-like [Macadamia integrifolia]|uniref:protein P21-like n=1 Tax=Macadamia integrifolia TaxID=60698 RepID=UPI001C52CAA2|nr:protein P21-like [Macadamia integrifolia]
MGMASNLPTFYFLFSIIVYCVSQATKFEITNQCSYTVWAASVWTVSIPGGGKQLKPGETWVINVTNSTSGRIWGRTNCTFDASGNGSCETGGCNNKFDCKEDKAVSPVTLTEFSVNGLSNLDFYDLSLLHGFNIPMEISPKNVSCRAVKCAADIEGECPVELRTTGGCNHPCTVFKTDLFCCSTGNCTATYLSDFFKTKCPDAYSFALDANSTTFTCPSGSNYRVLFCPLVSSPSPVSPPPPPDASLPHMCIRMINVQYY